MVVTFCILVDAEVIRMQVYRYIVVIKRVFDEGTSYDFLVMFLVIFFAFEDK